MSHPPGGLIDRSSRMATDWCSVWLEESSRVGGGSGPRPGPPGTRPASTRCLADLVGDADRTFGSGGAEALDYEPKASKPVVAPGKGRAIMAVAESRSAVPAVLYDVDEAAEALRLSRSVLYELIRSGRLRTVKQAAGGWCRCRRWPSTSTRWVVGRDASCPWGWRAASGSWSLVRVLPSGTERVARALGIFSSLSTTLSTSALDEQRRE